VNRLRSFFGFLGRLMMRGFKLAQKRGLSDFALETALQLARAAQSTSQDGQTKHDWVLGQLTQRGLSENIARGAIFLAVEIIKGDRK